MESNLSKAAKMLEEASSLLKSSEKAQSSSTRNSRFEQSKLQETLDRASSMLTASSQGGLMRRMNRNERLRAVKPYSNSNSRNFSRKTEYPKPKKPVQFALLRCFTEGDEDSQHLKWDSIIAEGMIMLSDDEKEITVRECIKDSLSKKFPLLSENDFEFVKVRYKQINSLELGPGTEFSYPVIKKMSGQGLLYVKVKQGFECIYESAHENGSDVDDRNDDDYGDDFKKPEETEKIQTKNKDSLPSASNQNDPVEIQSDDDDFNNPVFGTIEHSPTSSDPTDCLISSIREKGLNDPVEILRFLQKEMVKGRVLESVSETEEVEGDTNNICVDRNQIMHTTFAEFEAIKDFNLTFEIDFMNEKSRDLGGPRKEWIRLMNISIKEKYFDNGLREHLFEDYYHVGVMIGIALLQNGQLPRYMPLDIIDKLITTTTDKCISNIQQGLDVFGLTKIMRNFPILLHLLRPSNHQLTPNILLKLLHAKFSEEGSSALLREKQMYALFVKYIREVGSGRRSLTLQNVLAFCTGATEEPVLGFSINPSIHFIKGQTPEVCIIFI